jgi:threonylcarbamoyladenosine tRNA methylthiotransferase MtaB
LRETPRVSRHLHVPLQSGDDVVLHAMRRRYSVAQFEARLEPLRDFNLTTDVIVGFPDEDGPAFERTVATVGRVGFTKVHVFPYSPRPGTRTEAADPVPVAEKRRRSAVLRHVSDEASRRRWAARVGRVEDVLVDRPGRGYADDYTPWLIDAPVGQVVRGRAVGVGAEGVLAVAA